MKKIFTFVAACISLEACDADKKSDVIMQQCGDYAVEISITENGGKINAVLNGDAVELTNSVSASGAKFDGVLNDTSVTLWNRGESWILILDNDAVVECVAK